MERDRQANKAEASVGQEGMGERLRTAQKEEIVGTSLCREGERLHW